MALSCHLALDLLCQEMQEAWKSMHCRQLRGPLLHRLNVSPILEGLQQCGVGCDRRTTSYELARSISGETGKVVLK